MSQSSAARKVRLVYISHMVTPHQVRYCNALQNHIDAEFWFYESAAETRGSWWDVDLGKKCFVLDTIIGTGTGRLSAKYVARGIVDRLNKFNPDVVMLGGFSVPSNYVAYRWALKRGKKTIVFTERSRDSSGNLRRRGVVWSLIRYLYRKLDVVMVSADDIRDQFKNEFRFGDKVVVGRYPSDLDSYFEHKPRVAKSGYTYIFPNRLIDIYNPLGAIEIFALIYKRYPSSKLLMNAVGPLRDECELFVRSMQMAESVEFLDDIASWDTLGSIYERSDIMIFPAKFSNGNYTILEAMASGMGIVISDRILGVGNYISDNVNGFRCAPDAESFLERVQKYIDDPRLFQEHAEENRRMVYPLSIGGTADDFSVFLKENFRSHVDWDSTESETSDKGVP